jgi:Spy/CpxP family protein refolding chaperone
MKKLIVALMIGIAPLLSLHAQQDGGNENAIESLKIAFLTKQLDLTPDEAQKFWPVYNQYTMELKKMRKDHTGDELEMREKALTLTKRFKPELIKCVGPNKFNRLLKSEGDWHQVVRDEIKRRQEQRQKMRKNRPGGN